MVADLQEKTCSEGLMERKTDRHLQRLVDAIDKPWMEMLSHLS